MTIPAFLGFESTDRRDPAVELFDEPHDVVLVPGDERVRMLTFTDDNVGERADKDLELPKELALDE